MGPPGFLIMTCTPPPRFQAQSQLFLRPSEDRWDLTCHNPRGLGKTVAHTRGGIQQEDALNS
jgi:hypothetical protein